MTMHREEPKCRYGFRKGDVVLTPLRRRAVLTMYHDGSEKWSGRYVNAIDGQMAEETIISACLLTHAD